MAAASGPRRLARNRSRGASLESESIVKLPFATHGSTEQLLEHLHHFREHATARWKAVAAIFSPYLEGDEPFPDRTHVNAHAASLVLDTARGKPPGRIGQSKGSEVAHDRGLSRSRLNARRPRSRPRLRSAMSRRPLLRRSAGAADSLQTKERATGWSTYGARLRPCGTF
jgi:hypothetical protein